MRVNWRSGCKPSSEVQAGDVISVAGKVCEAALCARLSCHMRLSCLVRPAGGAPITARAGGWLEVSMLATPALPSCPAGSLKSYVPPAPTPLQGRLEVRGASRTQKGKYSVQMARFL